MISPLEKSGKGGGGGGISSSNARSPSVGKIERTTRSSPAESKPLGFKPYETNVVTKKSSSSSSSSSSIDDGSCRPNSKNSVHSVVNHSVTSQDNSGVGCNNVSANSGATICDNQSDKKSCSSSSSSSSGSRTPLSRKSASPSTERKTPGGGDNRDKTRSPQTTTNNNHQNQHQHQQQHQGNGASPVIRSGMEILAGHQKEAAAAAAAALAAYKSSSGSLSGFGNGNPLCCPPGISENPAFRPPFAGASPFSHHHAAAAALLGYPSPSAAGSGGGSPYLSYARVKTPAGGEALVPVCKDPYCTGCQYSMHNAQMMMGAGSCPSGCTQCDHQKYGLAMALSSLGPMPPPPSLSYQSSLAGAGRPFVCNWIAGEAYCGKRFSTSEELLQHLRSHTSLGAPDPNAGGPAGIMSGPGHTHHPLLSPSAALHRAAAAAAASYPAPSLSPLSARYHPYGKPPTGPLPASLAASPYSAFNALGPYYSPYAIYGQRIGAAVHQ